MKRHFFAAFIFLFAFSSFGMTRGIDSSGTDSLENNTVIRAMDDEIQRNLQQLVEDGYNKPFFIAYNISDLSMSYSISLLGSVLNANKSTNRNWYARVIVGDYEINDENFDNSFEGYTFDPGYEPLPLNDDYWGIRRSLWIATNNIYKSAARNYKQKIEVLKENDQEYLLPDFSTEKPVLYYKKPVSNQPSIDQLKNISKTVSSIFKDYPNFLNSTVIAYHIYAVNYFVNSEGSKMIAPINLSSLNIQVSKGKNEMSMDGYLNYFGNDIGDIPSVEVISDDIEKIIENIREVDSLEDYKEEYLGPLLIEGQAVAQFFLANLFHSGKDGIIASRKNMVNSNDQNFKKHFKELQEELEDSDDNKVAASELTVECLPFLKEYEGKELIGHFEIDGECVVPEQELVLIQNGVLQTKLNDRVPAPGVERSNGHKRFYVSNGDIAKSISPGVLKITFDNTISYDSLIQAFKREASDDEADYGLTVESIELISALKPANVYKYGFADDKKERLKADLTGYKKKNALKKIVAASDTYEVYNLLWSGGHGNMGAGSFGGIPISVIVPSAILIKDYDFSPYNYKNENLKPVIKGPFEQ